MLKKIDYVNSSTNNKEIENTQDNIKDIQIDYVNPSTNNKEIKNTQNKIKDIQTKIINIQKELTKINVKNAEKALGINLSSTNPNSHWVATPCMNS